MYASYTAITWSNVTLNETFWIHATERKTSSGKQQTSEYERLLFGVELDDLKLRSYTDVSYNR